MTDSKIKATNFPDVANNTNTTSTNIIDLDNPMVKDAIVIYLATINTFAFALVIFDKIRFANHYQVRKQIIILRLLH